MSAFRLRLAAFGTTTGDKCANKHIDPNIGGRQIGISS